MTKTPSKIDQKFLSAAYQGDLQAMREALDGSADILACNTSGFNALILAAMGGKPDSIDFLLKRGMHIDTPTSTGETALNMALLTRHHQVATMLLDRGADASAENRNGRGTLHCLICALSDDTARNLALLHRLIDAGADPNAQTRVSETPLMYAAKAPGRVTDIVAALLERKADPDIQDYEDRTALMLVLQRKSLARKSIDALIDAGADVTLLNKKGLTALDAAAKIYGEELSLHMRNRAIDRDVSTMRYGTKKPLLLRRALNFRRKP